VPLPMTWASGKASRQTSAARAGMLAAAARRHSSAGRHTCDQAVGTKTRGRVAHGTGFLVGDNKNGDAGRYC
jgi:hypothetical protein